MMGIRRVDVASERFVGGVIRLLACAGWLALMEERYWVPRSASCQKGVSIAVPLGLDHVEGAL